MMTDRCTDLRRYIEETAPHERAIWRVVNAMLMLTPTFDDDPEALAYLRQMMTLAAHPVHRLGHARDELNYREGATP